MEEESDSCIGATSAVMQTSVISPVFTAPCELPYTLLTNAQKDVPETINRI